MATMKEAMVNREDGASMVEQSCRWSRTLGSLDRVQLLRDLIVPGYISIRDRVNKGQAYLYKYLWDDANVDWTVLDTSARSSTS
jgi:hypothetical protein